MGNTLIKYKETTSLNLSKYLFFDSKIDLNSSKIFKILSYNILADCYADPDWLKQSKKEDLEFKARSLKILKQIQGFDCDIICLQEVDHYHDFYKKQFDDLGYKNIYVRKLGPKHDGVLIGVKSDRYEIVNSVELDLNSDPEYANHPDFQRGSVALFAKIRDIQNPKIEINVLCTHLYWDPKFEHVKYLQTSVICKFLENKLEKDENVVICGDFNSMPSCRLVQMLMTKNAPVKNDKETLNSEGLEIMNKIYSGLGSVFKRFEFDNVYRHYGKLTGQADREYPSYTNYTDGFKDTLDYIFFSKKDFEVKGMLKLPTPEEINSKTLPNGEHPSDHLPIVGILELK